MPLQRERVWAAAMEAERLRPHTAPTGATAAVASATVRPSEGLTWQGRRLVLTSEVGLSRVGKRRAGAKGVITREERC